MTMGQRRHVVRKSSMISEKQTAKKHEAAQRYLFQMSGIPSGLHRKQQRTASQKQRPAEGERRTICVGAPDQTHVRSGHKNKLEEEKTLLNLKRGIDKELIQEGRNGNAGFVDLLILANSAELLESQGLHNVDKSLDATARIVNEQAEKDVLHDMDDSLDATDRIGDAQAEKDTLHDADKSMDATDRIGNAQAEKDVLQDVDKSLYATDRIGNARAEKDVSHMEGRIHRTHFGHQALMHLGLEIPRPIQDHVGEEHEHSDLKRVEDANIDDIVDADQVEGAMGVQEVPDLCVANKRAPKGLEAVKKQASLVGAVTKNTKELQPCVERDKIIPRAVRMTANIGDSREQSGACLRRKDRTGNMNGPLNENNPKFPQEHGHAPPNCQTDPSLTQMSDAVEDPDSDLFYIEKWKRQLLIRWSELLAIKLAELLKEGPSVVATETGPKGLGVRKHVSLVEAVATYTKELQLCVEPDKISPEAVRMTPDKGDCREQSDVCLLRKDSTINKNSPLNEKNPKSTQEHGHAPNCQTETSLSQMSGAVKGCDPVAHGKEKLKQRLVIQKSESLKNGPHVASRSKKYRKRPPLAVQLAELLKEGPSVAREKRMLRTSERRKQRSENPQPGLQPVIKFRHILPRPAQMASEHGDCIEEGDVTRQLAEDRSAKLKGSLPENNLQTQQECGYAPLCETEPSHIHLSEALESHDSVALDGGNQKWPAVIQIPESLDCNVPACHRQMLRSADQWTQPRQKTHGSEKHENAGFKSFEGSRNEESVEAQQVLGAHLQDTQEQSIMAKSGSDEIADIRKQASEADLVKVTNEKSVPFGADQLTEGTSAKNDCSLKDTNCSTQHGGGHASPNCEIIPTLILTSDHCVVPTIGSKQASVVMPKPTKKSCKICREKRKRLDEDFAIRKERPKRPPIVQLPETLKDRVAITRHNRMLRTLERRKQRYGVEFRATADLHWSQTNNAHNWWTWHLVNSQKYEQSHKAKQHSSIYLPYEEMEKQFRVAALEKEFRENSCMAAAREKQLKKLEEQRATKAALHQPANNPQPTDTDTCGEKDDPVAVDSNKDGS